MHNPASPRSLALLARPDLAGSITRDADWGGIGGADLRRRIVEIADYAHNDELAIADALADDLVREIAQLPEQASVFAVHKLAEDIELPNALDAEKIEKTAKAARLKLCDVYATIDRMLALPLRVVEAEEEDDDDANCFGKPLPHPLALLLVDVGEVINDLEAIGDDATEVAADLAKTAAALKKASE